MTKHQAWLLNKAKDLLQELLEAGCDVDELGPRGLDWADEAKVVVSQVTAELIWVNRPRTPRG